MFLLQSSIEIALHAITSRDAIDTTEIDATETAAVSKLYQKHQKITDYLLRHGCFGRR